MCDDPGPIQYDEVCDGVNPNPNHVGRRILAFIAVSTGMMMISFLSGIAIGMLIYLQMG